MRRAYDGLPGPAKIQSAERSLAISSACASGSAGGAERKVTASISRPTLSRKNCCAFSVSSSAFSWKPYGESSSTPRASGPSLAKVRWWGVTMVGLVSPDPRIVRMRGTG